MNEKERDRDRQRQRGFIQNYILQSRFEIPDQSSYTNLFSYSHRIYIIFILYIFGSHPIYMILVCVS